jgi:hypothetical protein
MVTMVTYIACLLLSLLLAAPGALAFSGHAMHGMRASQGMQGMSMTSAQPEGQTQTQTQSTQTQTHTQGLHSLLRKTGGLLLGATLLASPVTFPSPSYADDAAPAATTAAAYAVEKVCVPIHMPFPHPLCLYMTTHTY